MEPQLLFSTGDNYDLPAVAAPAAGEHDELEMGRATIEYGSMDSRLELARAAAQERASSVNSYDPFTRTTGRPGYKA